jgi:hypothetical protein
MVGVFNPKKFLELGKTLLRDSHYDEDCRVRTVFGRLYYAAFLVALKRLERAGIRIQDNSKVHQEVIDAYMDNYFTEIGNKLDQLREMRRAADYNMMAELALNECRMYAQLSERTIQLIDQIKAFP